MTIAGRSPNCGFEGSVPPAFDAGAFTLTSGNVTIYVPRDSLDAYKAALAPSHDIRQDAILPYDAAAQGGGGLAFTDEGRVAGYARSGVAWCAANGVMTGAPGGAFGPEAPLTRAEAAAVLRRYAAVVSSPWVGWLDKPPLVSG